MVVKQSTISCNYIHLTFSTRWLFSVQTWSTPGVCQDMGCMRLIMELSQQNWDDWQP